MNKHSGVEIAYHMLVVIGLLVFPLGNQKTVLQVLAGPATDTVRYAAPGGLTSGDCDSWANACELQTALGVAAAQDEVWVKQGVYKPTIGADRTISFVLKTGLGVYGGFNGAETAREQRDWSAHITILSGDIDNNDNTNPTGVVINPADIIGANSYHVVVSPNVNNSAVLDGFFITAGQANGDGPHASSCDGPYCGGGMYNEGGGPVLSNLTFTGNTSNWGGGGMFNNGSSPSLTNVTFRNNASTSGGGMFSNFNTHPTLNNVTFTGNSALDSGGGMFNQFASPTLVNVIFNGNLCLGSGGGGGMRNSYSSPTLSWVTFIENASDSSGGAMLNDTSSPVLNHVVFTENSAVVHGGGMVNSGGGSPKLLDTTFSGNTAGGMGGGMYNSVSSPTITGAIFSGNSAGGGGGIYNINSHLWLTNAVISGNSAGSGGGIFNFAFSDPVLTNVTISGNSVMSGGGGIYHDSTSASLVQNGLLWGNAPDQVFKDGGGNASTFRYSLVEGCKPGGVWNPACGADGGQNLPDVNPLFVEPQPASGAPTLAGDYRLQDASPAINMGDNEADLDWTGPLTATLQTITADLAGNPRFVRAFVDLGAYENQTFHCPAGGVLFVDQEAAGAQSGASWGDGLLTLQDALQVSEACEIWVKNGMYYPDEGGSHADNDRTATFQLKNGVALYGGFTGTETSRAQRDWISHVTVLSGDIDNNDISSPTGVVTDTANINGPNSYHVVDGSSTNSSAILDGVAITAGSANGDYENTRGGGIYNNKGSPELAHIVFSGNRADAGGGIYNYTSSPSLSYVTFVGNHAGLGGGMFNQYSSNPSLTNVIFTSNLADNVGGGIYNQFDSSPSLVDVTFSGNRSSGHGGGMLNEINCSPSLINVTFSDNQANLNGGGMHNSSNSSPTLTNLTFSGNYAPLAGGGMYNNDNSSPNLMDATFTGNSADGGGGMHNSSNSNPILTNVTFNSNQAREGGALQNSSSNPVLTNVTFVNNQADYNAGGMYNLSSSPQLTNVLFAGNTAGSFGGGIANWPNSIPLLTNVVFSGNQAVNGGGMWNNISFPVLTNVTFSGNTATNFGGAIWNGGGGSDQVLQNSLLWGNTASAGQQVYNEADNNTTIHYSLIAGCNPSGVWNSACGADGGGNLSDADPRFVNAVGGDLRLSPSSPAIDAGNNVYITATTDLSGKPRFVDIPTAPDTGTGTPPLVDLGAYEAAWLYQAFLPFLRRP